MPEDRCEHFHTLHRVKLLSSPSPRPPTDVAQNCEPETYTAQGTHTWARVPAEPKGDVETDWDFKLQTLVNYTFNCKCFCCALCQAHSRRYSCANQTSQNNVIHQQLKSVQIVSAEKLSRSQKGTDFKGAASSLLWKIWFPHLYQLCCLSLDYQRVCTPDKSKFAKLHLHTQFSQAFINLQRLVELEALPYFMHMCCFSKKTLKLRDIPKRFPNFLGSWCFQCLSNLF